MFKIFAPKTATAPARDTDPDLGIPYGDPGTPERLTWIKADRAEMVADDTAEMQRRLARYNS